MQKLSFYLKISLYLKKKNQETAGDLLISEFFMPLFLELGFF